MGESRKAPRPVHPSDESPAVEQKTGNHDPANGHFVLGNTAAEKKPKRGVPQIDPDRASGEQLKIRSDTDEWSSRLRRDQGGPDMSAAREGATRKMYFLEFASEVLGRDLQENGFFTKRGRVRSTYPLLLQTLDRWRQYAALLGLNAREKAIDMTPEQWLQTPVTTDPTDELATETPPKQQPQGGSS